MMIHMGTEKPMQILCPGCGVGLKPYVFTHCPRCGAELPKQYQPAKEKTRTQGRKKTKRMKRGKKPR